MADGPHGHIRVTPQLALFHIAIANPTAHENLLQRSNIGESFLGRAHVRLAHDLHEGDAGPVEVYAAGGFKVGAFGDILFEVRSRDADRLRLSAIQLDLHRAFRAEGQVILRNLVVLWHVGIKVTFSIPLAEPGNFTPNH